jgi:hypothetical protein
MMNMMGSINDSPQIRWNQWTIWLAEDEAEVSFGNYHPNIGSQDWCHVSI